MPLISQANHRPWALPSTPWVMHQRWHELLFAHWALPPALVHSLIPSTLELDTFAGQAWIGVVPFRMSQVNPRGLPAVPWLSAFPELNVRTYVRVGDKPGVYFFSLEASNPVAVWAARQFFHLPYYNAKMRCQLLPDGTVQYHSQRTHQGAQPARFEGRYRPTGAVFHSQEGTLEHWLTSRYALYTHNRQGRLLRGEIHHLPWELQPAEAEITVNTMIAPLGITLPDTAPLLHYSHDLEVLVWRLVPTDPLRHHS